MWLWLVIVTCSACGGNTSFQNSNILGLWKMELAADDDSTSIPFFIEFIEIDSVLKAAIWNGEEQIIHESIQFKQDSLWIESPFFNSTLVIGFNKNVAGGYWVDYSRESYRMPLIGKYNLSQRFRFQGPLENTIDGKWQVTFSPNTEDAYSAIGLFETDDNSMKGTFITETGDYRFLEGGFATSQLKLSTFDGSHAFLFEADLLNDTLRGQFYSGKHWNEPFIAWRNKNPVLTDPYQMTTLVDQSKPISFAFKDMEGNLVTSEDSVYHEKPMLVQIIGSWCPNCMDELAFLVQNQTAIKELGIEIVGLSFERLEYNEATGPLKKLKKNLGIEYPILYGGKANKKDAAKEIPWIKDIKSYPTLLFVLPNKKVFKIHTGFYGPGTKEYYIQQSSELLDDMKQLSKLSNAIR
ncbi:MAG: thiol-disulfide isomerase/thioredoxin [Bacteroidia bacterium]|jgi:thiol-disulfide isomerase/thioredoxin